MTIDETAGTVLAAEVQGPWLDPGVAAAYARWHPWLERCFEPTAHALVAAAGVRPKMRVLDVASGTGIPALAIARLVGPAGQVTATDPAGDLLAAAEANARRLGLGNIAFRRAVAAALPFPDRAFDAATCHLGCMFFPDVGRGLGEIRRVVKPGGRAAFVAWGPEEKIAFFASFWGVIVRYEEAPPVEAGDEVLPEPVGPDPFRFAATGTLGGHLREAGFRDVREEELEVVLPWPGRTESLRRWWLDMAGIPEVIPSGRRAAFLEEVLAEMGRYAAGDRLDLPARVVVASGEAA